MVDKFACVLAGQYYFIRVDTQGKAMNLTLALSKNNSLWDSDLTVTEIIFPNNNKPYIESSSYYAPVSYNLFINFYIGFTEWRQYLRSVLQVQINLLFIKFSYMLVFEHYDSFCEVINYGKQEI